MKILILSSSGKALDNSPMWRSLGERARVDLRFLDKAQQRNLRRSLRGLNVQSYDCILLDLMFKHIYSQARFLRSLPRLVFYEEDAYLNFIPDSKWSGLFLRFYRKLPGIRVISTGAFVTQRLTAEGIDAYFVPKGFDGHHLSLQQRPRDIFLGFIGRIRSSTYAQRYQLLKELATVEPLQVLRTKEPHEYPVLLNRIQCFVSADIGLNEYMAKNFEAMACGCLLMAKRQGSGEEEALGLINGNNVLLYDNLYELREHIDWVRNNPSQASEIAAAGHALAFSRHEYSRLAQSVFQVLEKPFSPSEGQRGKWWMIWKWR